MPRFDSVLLDEIWTVRDVARYVKVARATVYSWVAQDLIPHFRVNGTSLRFRSESIRAWALGAARVTPETEDDNDS